MRAFAAIALSFVATTAMADGKADMEALARAIEATGCAVTNDNGDAILAASGLTEEQVFAAVAALYEAGLAVLEPDGSMSLHTEACK